MAQVEGKAPKGITAISPEVCKDIEDRLLQTTLEGIRIIRSPYTGNGPILVGHAAVGEASGATLHEALVNFAALVLAPPAENRVG